MIKEFLSINKAKLSFFFRSTVLIFAALLIVGIIARWIGKDEVPNLIQIVYLVLVFCIGLPLFIAIIAYFDWYSKSKVRNHVFAQSPFNELEKIGFVKSCINKTSRWYFTELTKETNINGYRIQADVKKDQKKVIEFKAFLNPVRMELDKLQAFDARKKAKNVQDDGDGVFISYNLKSAKNLTIEQLQSDLQEFVSYLKSENLLPKVEE